MQQISSLILHSDNQLIALNKPAGMPVQEDQSGDASLMRIAQAYCKHDLYPVHRLDRPASGIVVFAKHKKAAAALSEQWKQRKVEKIYLAIVEKGIDDRGHLVHQLTEEGQGNKVQVASEGQGTEAILRFEKLGESDNYALLQVNLETGRKHQVRAQLAAIGFPIKGDDKYGAKRGNRDRSIQLHAWKLAFRHPTKGEAVHLETAPPDIPIWNAFDIS